MTEKTENAQDRVIVTAPNGGKHAFTAPGFSVDEGFAYVEDPEQIIIAAFAPGAWTAAEMEGCRAESDADRYRRAYQAAAHGLDRVRDALRVGAATDVDAALAEADKASETAWCIAEDEL